MITKDLVIAAQNEWGAGVVKVGSLKADRPVCEQFTSEFLDKLYALYIFSLDTDVSYFNIFS